jgi:hypothetical protein
MQEYNMPDYKVRGVGSGKPMYNRRTIGIEDKRKDKKKVSNLITNNPFVDHVVKSEVSLNLRCLS